MKLINDKGMIGFGKWRINIIDLIACIFLLSFIPFFYYRHKLFTQKPITIKTWEKTMQCEYCDFPISKTIQWGKSPENEETKIICQRCGKEQTINFGFELFPKEDICWRGILGTPLGAKDVVKKQKDGSF